MARDGARIGAADHHLHMGGRARAEMLDEAGNDAIAVAQALEPAAKQARVMAQDRAAGEKRDDADQRNRNRRGREQQTHDQKHPTRNQEKKLPQRLSAPFDAQDLANREMGFKRLTRNRQKP